MPFPLIELAVPVLVKGVYHAAKHGGKHATKYAIPGFF